MKVRYGNKPVKIIHDPKYMLPILLSGQVIVILLLILLVLRG